MEQLALERSNSKKKNSMGASPPLLQRSRHSRRSASRPWPRPRRPPSLAAASQSGPPRRPGRACGRWSRRGGGRARPASRLRGRHRRRRCSRRCFFPGAKKTQQRERRCRGCSGRRRVAPCWWCCCRSPCVLKRCACCVPGRHQKRAEFGLREEEKNEFCFSEFFFLFVGSPSHWKKRTAIERLLSLSPFP